MGRSRGPGPGRPRHWANRRVQDTGSKWDGTFYPNANALPMTKLTTSTLHIVSGARRRARRGLGAASEAVWVRVRVKTKKKIDLCSAPLGGNCWSLNNGRLSWDV